MKEHNIWTWKAIEEDGEESALQEVAESPKVVIKFGLSKTHVIVITQQLSAREKTFDPTICL